MASTGKTLDIAIVGGSLGGLFAATPLLRMPQKHRVTILERSGTPLLHDQGAGVVAGGSVQKWVEKFDVFGKEARVTSKTRTYLNREGQIVDREDLTQWMTSWDLLYQLGRANFDGQQSGHVANQWDQVSDGPDGERVKEAWGRAKYEYGRAVEGLELAGDKVQISWRDTREGSPQKGEPGTLVVDFVVCADGPSSGMRKMLLNDKASQRIYAGYVAFRGTVPETELDDPARDAFVEKFTFFHTQGIQILGYTIPGANGDLELGKRLVNWVWYWNFPEDSEEYKEVLTDSNGNRHRYTLPTGGHIGEEVWNRQKGRAKEVLPPQFAQLVQKTQKPFVQAITDVTAPAQGAPVGRLLGGKAALLGDALAGFCPHTAASTSQAAFDALMLERAFAGEITWGQYEENVLQYANTWQRKGVMLGTCSQFENISTHASPLTMMARDQQFASRD
ncbi:uncharacterized protein A1O9_00635 [Exophiala aquamarina CBS 119918]|uniref:2,6-dihydroxypyridine 3-monooxygenase substrate binding domain-containing protein n=1 Tax=Exophiala aquamarina CBS 119918 TaxID=1182545 RepID=A0A072PSC2_9EURO|nr:uncharacterized protein A1O9_00635 [Exophiala aquamarina CBS 119918]KEF62662.1 hypothetical protein A1O9_00635 [Exophiala aquamarina CBS 119918]